MNQYTAAAERLETIINATYAAEGWKAEHDDLHDSLGYTGTRIGISPLRQLPAPGNGVILQTAIQVKFLGTYYKDVNNEQQVDPRIVADYAERFRRALFGPPIAPNQHHWYFNLTGIEYPRDPTGNVTRFVAALTAWSQNPEIVETTG